jgi:transglutaminase-like putative cysteine protease
MERHLRSHLVLEVHGPARLQLAVAVAPWDGVSDQLEVTLDGAPVALVPTTDALGNVQHLADLTPGRVTIDYVATVVGTAAPAPVLASDEITYVRPSRYCESDTLVPFALTEFAGLDGVELLAAVRSWVAGRLDYDVNATQPTDGAVATLLRSRGVCRDYAHLVVALLRAKDVPARVVSVYAPGLSPMDFHAVVEVLIDGRWLLVDATGLAPRQSMTRIAVGRDAADTAFMSTLHAPVDLLELEVMATADALPTDDLVAAVQLG